MLDRFVEERAGGARSKQHVKPLVDFSVAELVSRGIRESEISFGSEHGQFYQRSVNLTVERSGEVLVTLNIITQSGSVRKNLTNRKREIIGDAINLRTANPGSRVGLIYLLRADEEAVKKNSAGTSPLDELAIFLNEAQTLTKPLGRPLLDAAALIVADQQPSGRIRIEEVPPEVDVLQGFFDKLA